MREHQNHIEVRETAFTFTGGVTALNARGAAAPNSFNSVADFLLGTPTTLGNYVQFTYPLTLRTTEMAYYVRDQYQASRKLTVNYGLRWEYYPVPTQENQQLSYYDRTQTLSPGAVKVVFRKIAGCAHRRSCLPLASELLIGPSKIL